MSFSSSGSEDEEEAEEEPVFMSQHRPAVYIKDPRNTVEYAQNVRNFQRATDAVIHRLQAIYLGKDAKTMRKEWNALGEVLAGKESTYKNLVQSMPRMADQLGKEIARIKEIMAVLEIGVNTLELVEQTVRFGKTFHHGADEQRICSQCKTNENITHQSKDDERVVYCASCSAAVK